MINGLPWQAVVHFSQFRSMNGLRSLLIPVLFAPAISIAQEVCNNATDDDGDGLIDLNDTDCACATLINPEERPSFIVNHSFEDQDCCPFGLSTPGVNWLDCATAWNQATGATSDYYHTCGIFPAAYPQPPPDGQAVVGFISTPDYHEYVGACLTYPGVPQPLQAGTTYTISFWIATFGVVVDMSQTSFQALGDVYQDELPVAIYGRANCVPFPIPTLGCIGYEAGWVELGRVTNTPDGQWRRLSITFTPDVEVRSVIIGGACDIPGSFVNVPLTLPAPFGSTEATPYSLVDELMLTEAQDQVLLPVSHVGDVCANDVVLTASPPAGATGLQWYLNGVAIVGQTDTSLNASALGLGAGVYSVTSAFQGQCLMGSASVPPAVTPHPLPALANAQGCAPLTVSFADTTGGVVVSSTWSFGDGASGAGEALEHTYTAPGTYDVALQITTSSGCVRDTVLVGAVVVWPDPVGGITAAPDPADVSDPVVLLTGSSSVGEAVSWWWELGVGDPAQATTGSVSVTFPAEPGTYPVMLVITTDEGCVDTVRSEVVIMRNGVIEMPNVFSPNGDGINDRFLPMDLEGVAGRMEIYNRWGQLVYSTASLQLGWDGRADGSEVPAGTYYFVVIAQNGEQTRSGHVLLLR